MPRRLLKSFWSRRAESAVPALEYVSPVKRFLNLDGVAAMLLLGAALSALVLANSPLGDWYAHLWHTQAGLDIGVWSTSKPLHLWINDGLMAVFFFMVGLEIKRELLVGELASVRRAALPAIAALGGMICPAAIFWIFNRGGEGASGWGIPMATDIAFAAGCLSLLSGRVPPALSVFLVALAIVDDLGAVLVIAVFYTDKLDWTPLISGLVLIVISFALGRMGVRRTWPYVILFVLIWIAFFESGVHATVAGVLLALTIPADARYETPMFFGRMRVLMNRFSDAEDNRNPLLVNARQQHLIRSIFDECRHVEAPLQRIEHYLHPLCVFAIMPIFAFANAGVRLDWAHLGELMMTPVTLGVLLGLVLGKQVGVTLFSWLAVKLRIAVLPEGMGWGHVYGIGWLAGIGFTMSLFISELAFTGGEHVRGVVHLDEAKVGVFAASFIAGVVGLLVLRFVSPREAETVVDAEEG